MIERLPPRRDEGQDGAEGRAGGGVGDCGWCGIRVRVGVKMRWMGGEGTVEAADGPEGSGKGEGAGSVVCCTAGAGAGAREAKKLRMSALRGMVVRFRCHWELWEWVLEPNYCSPTGYDTWKASNVYS